MNLRNVTGDHDRLDANCIHYWYSLVREAIWCIDKKKTCQNKCIVLKFYYRKCEQFSFKIYIKKIITCYIQPNMLIWCLNPLNLKFHFMVKMHIVNTFIHFLKQHSNLTKSMHFKIKHKILFYFWRKKMLIFEIIIYKIESE